MNNALRSVSFFVLFAAAGLAQAADDAKAIVDGYMAAWNAHDVEKAGTFLAADGKPVDHVLNKTVIAMSPADLKKVPNSILISGGLYKADIIKAILTSGYVNNLVTDEAVAQRLLK